MVTHNKAVSFVIVLIFLLEIYMFYLLMTGGYMSSNCL